jgi:hypothetical protein
MIGANTVRFDATVTEAHILSPSDSRLLLDGVRVMVRLLTEAHRHLGPERVCFHNHRRVAKRRHRAIGSAPGAPDTPEVHARTKAALGSGLHPRELSFEHTLQIWTQ